MIEFEFPFNLSNASLKTSTSDDEAGFGLAVNTDVNLRNGQRFSFLKKGTQ